MIKVLSILGTRPEAIKMVPVIQELRRYPSAIVSKVCITAQHRQMLDQVLELFQVKPDYDLNIMKQKQSLTNITTGVLEELQPILQAEQPDWILIQGDTTSVMAAALAAFYRGIKIGHVEAGLTTSAQHRDQRVLQMAHDLRAFGDPDDVVAQDEASKEVVQVGNAAGDAVVCHIHRRLRRKQQRL